MKVIKGLGGLKRPIRASVITVGVFDGVHIGHRKILEKIVERAKALGAGSVVVTFDPHPLKVLNPKANVPSLISLGHRIRLIESAGVDCLIILKFTPSLARLPADVFIKDILIGRLGLKEIYVGEDFVFGKGAASGIDALRRSGRRLGFRAAVVRPVKVNGAVISSSLIRHLITSGDIGMASRYLGRPVSILGTVTGGAGRGRIIGFPTANVNPHHEAIPPSGVYAVKVRYSSSVLKGVLNIGFRPTFHKKAELPKDPLVEVHIFGFNGNIYGKDLEIIFVKKLRPERRFKNQEHLAAQIKKDVGRAHAISR